MDADRFARARLTFVAEPGDSVLAALVGTIGPADTISAILDEKLPSDLGDGQALSRWRSRIEEMPDAGQVSGWLDTGIRLVCPGDSEWPEQLDDLGPARPYALWLQGQADLRLSCLKSVSVVGSRAATAYGSYMATELSSGLSARGWTVVSGAAYGVDGAAHSGALAAGGTTAAVLACGVGRPYPAGHRDLLDQIAWHGVIASEWPPGRNPTRLRFLTRNRIIAALTPGTVVVEAGERSGSLT